MDEQWCSKPSNVGSNPIEGTMTIPFPYKEKPTKENLIKYSKGIKKLELKKKDLLRCPKCKRKFRKVDKHIYVPNCKKDCTFFKRNVKMSVG